MSTTASFYTITSAIAAAENEFLGGARDWHGVNKMQETLITEVLAPCRADLCRIPELETIAALSEAPINAWLREKKFDIQLDPFPKLTPPERAWGAASVLDVLFKWKVTGKRDVITTPARKDFPATLLAPATIELFMVSEHPYPLAAVITGSSDRVFMTICDEALEHFALINKAEALSSRKRRGALYEGLKFPMVDLDHRVDISWLKEMSTVDNEGFHNEITQALQQTKLKMNEKGMRVRDAVAIGGVRTLSLRKPLPPMVINKPFLVWVERPGLSRPLFAARITEDNWKDPGSLDDM